jgi:hypothetical protein
LSVADCANAAPRRYTIKGILAAGDVAVMIGAPGAGKSALAPYVAFAVAQGRTIFGRRVRPGKVLYVPAEDQHGMRSRVSALKIQYGDAPMFFLVDGVCDLFSSQGQADELKELVEHETPALVIIDTIAASFPGMQENESRDMGLVVKLARDLARGNDTRQGPAVILLHHIPKGSSDPTPRGHGILDGDADLVLRLNRDPETGIVAVTFGKNRNGPSYGTNMSFTIDSLCVGTDEDGDEITAPLAVESMSAASNARSRLTPRESRAVTFLADLINDQGRTLPTGPGWPENLAGVSETDWREACDERRLCTSDEKKNRGRVFRLVFQALLTKRAIGANAGMVWLTAPYRGDRGTDP